MRFPFVSRRRYAADLTAARAEAGRLREQRDTAVRDEETARFNRERILSQYTDLDEKYTDTNIINEVLTHELAALKGRLAEYGSARTVSDVLVEHDVHRKAIADALGEQKYHLNWDQLITEVGRLGKACKEWMADHAAATERAARLEAELDDARLLASRLTAAVESRQQAADLERPVDEAPLSRKEGPSARLRRERHRVRLLEQRLSDMQASHVADTRELHDLRQNGAAS